MADRLTVEHYIGKCFEKCAQIVLGSRVYQNEENKPSQDKRSAQWFLLEVEEHAGLSVRLEPWRRDIYAPLVIEIYIQPWDSSSVMIPPAASAARQDVNSSTPSTGSRTLLERWSLGYTAGSAAPPGAGASSRPVVEPAAVYKRLILLIRSLYSYVRVLPAYRMYRACKRHGRELFNTSYTLSTTPLPLMHQQQYGSTAATATGSSSSNRRMQQFVFSPIETMYGVFEMSVEYQPATTVQFLEQTTLLPCQPRIITDYVDGPYARSAPSDRVVRTHSSSSSSIATREDKSSETGASAFLLSSQHHAPLVRTSWSSKDIPVVQRGFNPPARSNSLNTAAAAAAAVATQQQQQQVLSLHRRSLSQGSGSAAGGSPRAAAAGSNTVTNVTSHHVTHNVTHVGSYGSSNAGLGTMQASAVFLGPSSLGKPPLPHSPATTAATAAASHLPHISSSSSASSYSNTLPGSSAAAAAAVMLPPASPGTPVGSSSRGVGSVLLRSLSANAAAAASAAAAAAAAAAGIASSAPGQAGAGLTTAAVQQLSRLGSSFSSSSSPMGSAPRVLGFGMQWQQQQHQQQKQPMDPQATQQGFHVKSSSSNSGCDVVSSSGNKQAGVPGQQSHLPAQQQQQQQEEEGNLAACGAISIDTAAATAAEGDLACARISSAPVPIPGRQKGRARSVTDLQHLVAVDRASAAAPHQQQHQLRQQEAAALHAQQQRQQLSSSSSLLRVRARQQDQQQVPVASSAPAAPRGMLGQLLSNSSNNTSPSVSPPHDTAAAAGASPRAALPAAGQHSDITHDDHADAIQAEQQEPTPAAAAGRSHAIIIRPQPLQHPYHTAAAAAGASPSPSSRLSYSRYGSSGSAAAAAYSLGAQPVTPGGPNSILSSSPQLPFAFTPSAASLGMSIITFPDQQKHLVQGSGATAAARGLARSRSGNAAAAAGVPGSGSAVGVGTAPGSGSLGTAAAAGSSSDGSGVNAIGTPSPPPHVSCVRDITGLATIRRPSWSSRSSSFDVAASASLPRHLSVSPMGDLLDPALLGCSNSSTHNALSGGHNAFALGSNALSVGRSNLGAAAGVRPAAAAATGVVMTPAVVLPGGFGSGDHDDGTAAAAAGGDGGSSGADQAGQDLNSCGNPAAAAASGDRPRSGSDSATAFADVMGQDTPAEAAAAAAAGSSAADQLLLGSVMPDESESDILPFAIDAEPYVSGGIIGCWSSTSSNSSEGDSRTYSAALFRTRLPAAAAGRGPRLRMQDHPAAETALGGPAAAAAAERDVAVGAFVKLIQEASCRQLHRHHQQQQQQMGNSGDLHPHNAQDNASRDLNHNQQQQQQLLVADALEQVQQMAAQLQVLVFPNGQ